MRTVVKEVDGLDWNDGAVCNCTWSGPLLADVLESAGLEIRSEDGHVCFDCWQTDVQDDDYYGASIPLTRCMDRSKKIILALEVWISHDRLIHNGRGLTVHIDERQTVDRQPRVSYSGRGSGDSGGAVD
jgi:hypothetical protein